MSIRSLARALAAAAVFCAPAAAQAEAPDVVASIRPLHSLVAAVMKGVGEPHLLVTGTQSPHSYALKPSDAGALGEAKAVFWIGPHYETFLTDALPQLSPNAQRFAVSEAPGLTFLPNREGGAFEAHDHAHEGEHEAGHEGEAHEAAEAGHAHADEAGHAGEADHEEAGHAEGAHAHAEGEEDHAGEDDPHVWLSPDNASAIVAAIAADLSRIDPANAAAYAANAEAERAKIAKAAAEAKAILAPDAGKGFVVTHDGFQYFEHAFGPKAVASVTINPDVTPSAARVSQIQARIAESGTRCLVSEPQFPKSLMQVFLTDDSRVAALDYVGIDHQPGPDLYTDLMVENARKLAECLGG